MCAHNTQARNTHIQSLLHEHVICRCDSANSFVCRTTGQMGTAAGQPLMISQLSAHPGWTLRSQLSDLTLSQTLLASKQTLALTPAKQKGAGLPLLRTHLPFPQLGLPLQRALLPFVQTHLKGRVIAISLTLMQRRLLAIAGLHLMIQMLFKVMLQQTQVLVRVLSSMAQCCLMTNLQNRHNLNLGKTTFGGHTHWPLWTMLTSVKCVQANT